MGSLLDGARVEQGVERELRVGLIDSEISQ